MIVICRLSDGIRIHAAHTLRVNSTVIGAAALPHCMLRVGAGALIATTSPLGLLCASVHC